MMVSTAADGRPQRYSLVRSPSLDRLAAGPSDTSQWLPVWGALLTLPGRRCRRQWAAALCCWPPPALAGLRCCVPAMPGDTAACGARLLCTLTAGHLVTAWSEG